MMLTLPQTPPPLPLESLTKRECGPRSARLQSQGPGWAQGWVGCVGLTSCHRPVPGEPDLRCGHVGHAAV